MLFGNTSLQDDAILHDAEFPDELVRHYGGPNHGLPGLRERAGAAGRALTCSALKPQGLPPARLAELAARFARGGIDYIKDDHGLADQDYSPFAARVEAIADALRAVERETGRRTRYVPSLTGDLDALRRADRGRAGGRHRRRDGAADDHAACRISRQLVRENPDIAFFAHPALAGAARIAPALLFGKIFRMLGADAVIFPNHGGRFGYSAETCRRDRRSGACAVAWMQSRDAGSGRRHDDASVSARCLISTARRSCC